MRLCDETNPYEMEYVRNEWIFSVFGSELYPHISFTFFDEDFFLRFGSLCCPPEHENISFCRMRSNVRHCTLKKHSALVAPLFTHNNTDDAAAAHSKRWRSEMRGGGRNCVHKLELVLLNSCYTKVEMNKFPEFMCTKTKQMEWNEREPVRVSVWRSDWQQFSHKNHDKYGVRWEKAHHKDAKKNIEKKWMWNWREFFSTLISFADWAYSRISLQIKNDNLQSSTAHNALEG